MLAERVVRGGALSAPRPPEPIGLDTALRRIAGRAGELDADPHFPRASFADLAAAGVLRDVARARGHRFTREVELVRAVAAVDAATARILDGHLNGLERLAMCGRPELVEREFDELAGGELLIGVWGADPAPGEGEPARIERSGGLLRLYGVKTFCSGAGGVGRAIVVARDDDGARRLAYIDPRERVSIDRSWFHGAGMRASESHRVRFDGTPLIALLGGPDELTREPWFSRDAIRTAATWAGLVDAILIAATWSLAGVAPDELRLLALGEVSLAQATIDRWLEHAVNALAGAGADARAQPDEPDGERIERTRRVAVQCRLVLAGAARRAADSAARAAGSRSLVSGGLLERSRRDLDLFLLQHRLEPRLAELGAGAIRDAGAERDPAARFEHLYATDDDPWRYDSSGYEREKRAATIAAIPPGPVARALDLGCSNGALTDLLAARCEQVLAIDFSARAIELAREREPAGNVELLHAQFPDETPPGPWDLIVCSEVLYYLAPAALLRAVRWLAGQLEHGASVLAVSWRGRGRDEPMLGDHVHDLLVQELAPWHGFDGRRPGYRLDRFDGRARR